MVAVISLNCDRGEGKFSSLAGCGLGGGVWVGVLGCVVVVGGGRWWDGVGWAPVLWGCCGAVVSGLVCAAG